MIAVMTDNTKSLIGNDVTESMTQIVTERYFTHPFRNQVNKENAKTVLADYLAMSKAFPFIAAGAQRNLILEIIESNTDVPEAFEITSVVSNFLSWDETGGHAMVRMHGNPGLPKILNTKSTFHANMLQNDLLKIFPVPIAPNFSSCTQKYLKKLLENLGHSDPIIRAATLTAFEMHAEEMITALWARIIELYGDRGEKLLYFQVHVGGDDPAEPYHVAMTQKMLEGILNNPASQEKQVERFLKAFEKAYAENFNWTLQLTEVK